MVDKILQSEEGISHDVFKELSQADGEEPAAADGDEDEEAVKPEKTPEEEALAMKHVYVPEVVREPRMKYYKVPKLGSFMAVPLVYDSCLFESALDNAVTDFIDVKGRKEEQNKLKEEYEEEKAKREEGEAPPEGEEEKEWEVIE